MSNEDNQQPIYPFLYANPPKWWRGHIPADRREQMQQANEARRQQALAFLASDEVQDALDVTGQAIVAEAAEQQLAQARDMFKRLLRWLEEGRFSSMENQHLQIHWLNEIRAFLASLEATDGR